MSGLKNIEGTNSDYYKHPIYDYWILSSHNTYLPFDQIIKSANMCYYNIILNTFMGGCIEIDLRSVYKTEDGKFDVMVRHSPSKLLGVNISKNYLQLSKILKKIVEIMKHKYELKNKGQTNLPVGPLIISFDNKDLKFKDKNDVNDIKEAQNVFWQILNDNLLKYDGQLCSSDINKCPWIQILKDDTLDYTKINLEDLDMKILLRGKERKGMERIINGGSQNKMFIPPQDKLFDGYKGLFMSKSRWFHLSNTKLNSFDNIAVNSNGNQIKNYSESIPSYGNKKAGGSSSENIKNVEQKHKINMNVIENSKYNLIRIFPDGLRLKSQNYDNLGYLLNGCQLVALNFQVIDKAWFQNMALFNPDFFTICDEDKCIRGKIQDIVAAKTNNIKSYVLKPKWLRSDSGDIKYPDNYDIEITLKLDLTEKKKKYENAKINISIGNIAKTIKNNGTVTLNEINVTLPILYIEIQTFNTHYKAAYLLDWDDVLFETKKKNIYLYKLKLDNIYNSIGMTDNYDSCETNNFMMSIHKKIKCELEYKWIKKTSQLDTEPGVKHTIDPTEPETEANPELDEDSKEDISLLPEFKNMVEQTK